MINFKAYFMVPCALVWLAYVPVTNADIRADADVIFNWAEKTFPTLLPTRAATQQLPPWIFRYYSSTELYVGVNSQDSRLYYISRRDLEKGVAPINYDSVSNLLKLAGNTPTPSSNSCSVSQVPAGHTLTQVGNTVKIATNGCIEEPKDTDYCPQKELAGGASVLITTEFVSTVNGVTDAATKVISCTINTAPVDYQVLESDVCYVNSTAKPPLRTTIKGRVVLEKISDCLKSNADFVTDLVTNTAYIKGPQGFEIVPRF